jgi:hypothetical protein
MSVEIALARGQAAAERLMTDACVIKHKTTESVGAGGVISPVWSTVFTGKCRVQSNALTRQGQDIGEAYVIVERHEVQLPVSVVGLQEGDLIQITASGDADLVGRIFRVRDVLRKTHLTARRVTVLEVTS